MKKPYDFIILGSGTTAFAAAMRGAELGARVLMVEQSHLGGTCVNWGCVPSKTLIHHAKVRYDAITERAFGQSLEQGPIDWPLLMRAKQRAVETVRWQNYQLPLEQNSNIEVLRGHGRFLSPRELRVGAEILASDRFLIACGGEPRIFDIPGMRDIPYLTSYSALHLSTFPRSLIILGGGVIALEMGQMFQRFGTQVTILERGERALKECDPRLTSTLQRILEQEGVKLFFGVETQRVYREGEETRVLATIQGEERVFSAERFMLAVGTAPATEGIGLDLAGVQVNAAGFIVTDEEMRTSAPGIWAAGDVTGPPLIAPAGSREGEVAADNMLNPDAHRRIDHRNTPMAVFINPEVAMVGVSADQAREEGKEVVETYMDLDEVAKSHVIGGRQGAFLLVAERGSGRVLGVQILAPRAADIIHEATLAVRHGLSVYDLAETIHVYPSLSDGLRLAAQKNIHQQRQVQNLGE